MLIDAPKAAAPLVDVPTPRCTCTELRLDARSGMLTQYTRWLSGLLMGTPLIVTLMRVPSVPRTRIDV